jgi:hypothetical protein
MGYLWRFRDFSQRDEDSGFFLAAMSGSLDETKCNQG